jgi:hypothetical protein
LDDARAALANFAHNYPDSQLEPEYERVLRPVEELARARGSSPSSP